MDQEWYQSLALANVQKNDLSELTFIPAQEFIAAHLVEKEFILQDYEGVRSFLRNRKVEEKIENLGLQQFKIWIYEEKLKQKKRKIDVLINNQNYENHQNMFIREEVEPNLSGLLNLSIAIFLNKAYLGSRNPDYSFEKGATFA